MSDKVKNSPSLRLSDTGTQYAFLFQLIPIQAQNSCSDATNPNP